MLHPFAAQNRFLKNFVVLGLRKITEIIKAVVEAEKLPCVDAAFGFCVHCFEPVQSVGYYKI
jgi:hypothetical protein